jgi:alanine racemase
LWGKNLPVEEVAYLSGTIAYELLCHVNSRVTKVEL